MAKIPIDLSRGFQNNRDPIAGELTRAKNAYYRPGDSRIYSLPGPKEIASGETDATGIRYLNRQLVDSLLVVQAGTILRKATANLEPTFSDLKTGVAVGTHLDSLHFSNDSHILLNGGGPGQVVASDDTVVEMGMKEVVTPPTIESQVGAGGGYRQMPLSNGSTYKVWIVEALLDGDPTVNEPEFTIIKQSGATLDAVANLVGDGTDDYWLITRPAILNADATHWAVFMSDLGGQYPFAYACVRNTNAQGFASNIWYPVAEADTTTGASTATTDPEVKNPGAWWKLNPLDPYQLQVARPGGVPQTVSRYGPRPETPSTGDVFENSVVCNDLNEPWVVRYSDPGDPHTFPAFNAFAVRTKRGDAVKLIRTIDEVLAVCSVEHLFIARYLPRPIDAEFDTGRAFIPVDGAFGCVGPMAGDTFSWGQGLRLAYVSKHGIIVTDTQGWDVLTEDIHWENTVDVSLLANSRLINHPRLWLLEFTYTSPAGALETILLHYHPSHNKNTGSDFRAKLTGPHPARSVQVDRMTLDDVDHLISVTSAGQLWQEHAGGADVAARDVDIRTPTFYHAGIGSELEHREMFLRHAAAPGVSLQVSSKEYNSGRAPTERRWEDVDMAFEEATQVAVPGRGEAFDYRFRVPELSGSSEIALTGAVVRVDGDEETEAA